MSHPFAKLARNRVAGSTTTWALVLLAYGTVVLVLLAPVLFAPISADDRNWVLERGPMNDGSVWQAFWTPLRHAFDFQGNPRGTALAISDRSVVALVTMKIAVTFSIPPLFVWALLKLSLFVLSIVAVRTFLRQVTFRDAQGAVRGLKPQSVAFITISLPLMIAIGVKSQNLGSFNGWNHYPPLTWGTFCGYFLFAALALKLSKLLQRDFRTWSVPVVVLMVLSGILINLSYEMVALTIPIVGLMLLLQPLPERESWWLRWRPRVMIVGPLLISYVALFAWIRVLLSRRPCVDRGDCYPGTVLQVEPRTLFNNFVGALPGNNGAEVSRQAEMSDRSFPEAGTASIALAVVAVLLMWGTWRVWRARHRPVDHDAQPSQTLEGDDRRGLITVLVLALCTAIGSATITGISALAVESIQTPLVSYRSSVVTWSALALAAVVGLLLLMRATVRPVAWVAIGAITVVMLGSVAVYFPRNVFSAQVNRTSFTSQYNDTMQLEVAEGVVSDRGDERRCAEIAFQLKTRHLAPTDSLGRTTESAYRAFEFYHGAPYCSKGLGRAPSPSS